MLANADFVIQDADTVRHRSCVVVDGNQIAEVREFCRDLATNCNIIDCSGLLLMPGFVNAHTHLFQVLTRGLGKELGVREWAKSVTYPVARRLAADEYYAAALLACADSIRNGCTALVDHSTHFARFYADQSCRALLDAGLRGAVARGGSDMSLVDDGEARSLDADLYDTAEFLARWSEAGRVQGWVGPSGFHSCSPKALQAFKRLAQTSRTRFHLHLAESSAGLAEAKEAGFLGEAHWAEELGLVDEGSSFAHAVWVCDNEIERIARKGCYVVHCATSNQLLASGVAPFRAMLDAGVPVALATDGASSNDCLDMVAEMKSAALLARVTDHRPDATKARDVFHAATEAGARLMGYEKLGRIAPGYLADIIGVRLRDNPSLTPCNDPLATIVFSASGRDVAFVMVDGAVLFRDSKFVTLDIRHVIDQVNAIAARYREDFWQTDSVRVQTGVA